jgi:adenylate cyclase
MNARLERKLRLLAAIVIGSVIGAIGFVLARGLTSPTGIEIGILYGLILSVAIGGISQFVLEGPMRGWLGSLSFTASLMVRSAVYAAIIVPVLFFQLGDVIAGNPRDPLHSGFWTSIAYSVAFVILANLVIGIANIIGPRAFLNFITGRYHSPSRKTALCCLSTSRDRPGSPSASAASPFTVCSIAPFAFSPLPSWTIAAKSSTMSATR